MESGLVYLLFMLSLTIGEQTTNIMLQSFVNALMNGHDDRQSFSENIYLLLEASCPGSMFCKEDKLPEIAEKVLNTTNNTIETSNFTAKMQSLELGDLHFIKARKLVTTYSQLIPGCCSLCSCEEDCVEKRNCCPMMPMGVSAPKESTNQSTRHITQECVVANIKYYIPGGISSRSDTDGLSYYMVTDCFSANVNEDVAYKCRYPNAKLSSEATPVFSHSSGRNYKNRFCAECNNDVNVTLWSRIIHFHPRLSLIGDITIPLTEKEVRALPVERFRFAQLIFEPPEQVLSNSLKYICKSAEFMQESVVGSCRNASNWNHMQATFLQKACAFRTTKNDAATSMTFTTSSTVYANLFCFVCENTATLRLIGNPLICQSPTRLTDKSLKAILEPDWTVPTDQELEHREKGGHCQCTELYDARKKSCRQVICPPGTSVLSCACADFLTHVTGMNIKVFLDLIPKLQYGNSDKSNFGGKIGGNLARSIASKVSKIFNSRWGPVRIDHWIVYRETSASDRNYIKFYTIFTMHLQSLTDNRQLMRQMINNFQVGISTSLLGLPFKISLGRFRKYLAKSSDQARMASFTESNESDTARDLLGSNTIVDRYESGPNIDEVNHSQALNRLVYCKRIKLETDEISWLQNYTRIEHLFVPYVDYFYWKKDESICIEEFQTLFLRNASITRFSQNNCVCILVYIFCLWIKID